MPGKGTRRGSKSSGGENKFTRSDNENGGNDNGKSSPVQKTNASPVQSRLANEREKLLQIPTATLTPLARPALGIRVLPSSVVDAANLFSFGDIYQSDLSNLRQFEIVNLQSCSVRVDLKADIRKPFHASTWGFQTHNENLPDEESTPSDDTGFVRSLSKSSFSSSTADTTFMDEGFNELFNQMGLIDSIILEPHQSQRIIFSICVKFDSAPQHQSSSGLNSTSHRTADDSSDDERMHLHETSFVTLSGRLLFSTTLLDTVASSTANDSTIAVPLQGNVCRSLLRLDVKELHFDDCVPGGSYVKDFTVWNRSEIPLIFRLVTSVSAQEKQLLMCSDYNTGYSLGESPYSVAAYSHMRIRVTYRPQEVGEQFFEILAQNLHDSRNVKTLNIHAIASKEHHREGLSIREPNGSYLMSGSALDFGDCYTGMPTSKVLLLKNMTEAALHIELLSERPKDITFELKVVQNRARSSRSRIGYGLEDPLSPNEAERRLSLSPPSSPGRLAYTASQQSLLPDGITNMDSDDEPDEQDGDYVNEDDSTMMYQTRKRGSYDDQMMSEADDIDDDMEFDGEKPISLPLSPSSSKEDGPSLGNIPPIGLGSSITKSTTPRTRSKRPLRIHTRVKDLAESGAESSIGSSPERSKRKSKSKATTVIDNDHMNNFLVEALDLPPGVERTVLVWYCPILKSSLDDPTIDLKCCRLTKQSFRLNFRCYTIDGAWTGSSTQRIHDRSLGKSLLIGARTCTSYVTLTPSILHLGDCNIGELKSSSCTLTNHSELPTIIKPSVISKVISIVPNDTITLGPKQSIELKIEIIPRKINPNYSRIISIINLKNKLNHAQVTIRSSNMDAHHVIYHSLFYKLITPSKSAFLNFEYVAANSMSMKVFMLENITLAPLRLRVQSSDLSRVQLYCLADSQAETFKHSSTTSLTSPPSMINLPPTHLKKTPLLRRRRSFGCISELNIKSKLSTSRLTELLKKKIKSTKEEFNLNKKENNENSIVSTTHEVFNLFETTWCIDKDEESIVSIIRERVRRFHTLVLEKQIIPISTAIEWNIRIPPKCAFPILAVLTPKNADIVENKSRVEKYKVFITLPAGGNKPIDNSISPFDSRPSVRELLLKSRVCRSVLNVNQKNINFGRMTTFSKSSKKVLIHNGSAIPLIYIVEKTGSISSGFLEIKDGAQGVIKPFGTRQVHFEFLPTLAGPFEEKLKIINVQDIENSIFITIKSKVVKRETFKLPQAGEPIDLGICLVGEKSEIFKVTIRNMSKKKREYIIQVDFLNNFTNVSLRPTFQFTMDDIPAANITQAQEKKLDEELEKLEHKLRIATTKKKDEKIIKLKLKINHVKSLLSGEEIKLLKKTEYDSANSESESENEIKNNTKQKNSRKSLTSMTSQLNQLHFTLEPEATGRIVGQVIFHQVGEITTTKSNIRHRGHRRKQKSLPAGAAVPIYGTGKFLFYEQQNKDVMKELQYKAQVYLRTPAGEAAYCRATNKTLLPPMPASKQKTSENSQLSVELKNDLGSTRGFVMLVPVEEAPCDSQGWTVSLRAKEAMEVEIRWTPFEIFHDLIVFSAQLVDSDENSGQTLLPLTLAIYPDAPVTLHIKWSFSAKSSLLPSAPLAKLVSGEILKKPNDLPGGQLHFQCTDRGISHHLDVIIIKAKPRSIVVDTERIDLGEVQLGTESNSHFYIRNVSKHGIKFLVLVNTEEQPNQVTILNATGRIDAGGTTMIRFSYTGTVSGKRSEHILVRNLNEKLDFATLTVTVRVTRPVYVRIPELDPHMTGQLMELNIGPCYVTPEDNSNDVSRFSKIRKLTFVSQVNETLYLSASSNLKTQCYVYQDASLQHDANSIVLLGMESIDLYIAFRPRLPNDAFKTGIARDLFGGIRVQLFRNNENLAAEFTVKFVGIVGASICTVYPSLIDFGNEINIGRLTRCKIHKNKFQIKNLSKSLPLQYRLSFIESDHYSDDDTSLHIYLRHEKGDILPGENTTIEFTVMAYTNGLFRRRIFIENLFNPINYNYIDIILFVDNGTIEFKKIKNINFGFISLFSNDFLFGGNIYDTMKRYRIYQSNIIQETISITNRSILPIHLRPLSNIPLLFQWNKIDGEKWDTFAWTIDRKNAREILLPHIPLKDQINQSNLYYGQFGLLPPQTTVTLTISIPSIASTCLLPIEYIENGRTISMDGFIALQSFQQLYDDTEATTLGVIPIAGIYGESKLIVPVSVISLGKLGYGRPYSFEIEVKNMSELPTSFYLSPLPPCFTLVDVEENIHCRSLSYHDTTTELKSLKQLVQEKISLICWDLDGYDTATMKFQCLPECLTAGRHELSFKIYNLNHPQNVIDVSVSMHVIAKYIQISLDSECLNPAMPNETSVGYFEPIVIPMTESPPGFLCTLVNVFDEDVDIQLTCETFSLLDGHARLEIVSRTSNTPLTTISLAPGDRIDLRISCRLIDSNHFNQTLISKATTRFDQAIPFGTVSIVAVCSDVALSCCERIDVCGSFVLGQTFTVSNTSLRFDAKAIAAQPHFYQLIADERSFTILNPSTSQPLSFSIESIPWPCPGSLFLLQETILGNALIAKCIPDHGILPPGESMTIGISLQEAKESLSIDSKCMQLIIRDKDQSYSTVDLFIDLDESKPILIDGELIDHALADRITPSIPLTQEKTRGNDMTLPRNSMSDEKKMNSIEKGNIGSNGIALRGCTPAENSTLDNALYVIDVGQHTVRSGSDVEWEISLHVEKEMEYRFYLADANAISWLKLSRTHGTIVNFQTIMLRFNRDIIGVYSTFVVLENCTNPNDLKLIRVKLEVIADLNALRAMTKDRGETTPLNLFRVLVSSYSSSKRQRRKSSDDLLGDMTSGKLEIEYGDVYYDKLYHNHSLVLENFSSLSLDFMLSSNGRSHEVGFSMTPNSFNEISCVTLGAYARQQVFLNFRPAPKTQLPEPPTSTWIRNIEVYINCRLVKDFRETVFLKAICNYPQVNLHIASNQPIQNNPSSYNEPAAPYFPSQPTFLGMGFMAPESVLIDETGCAFIEPKYLVMKNTRDDSNAHVAIRNDSMFFDVSIDHIVRGSTNECESHPWTGIVRLEPQDIAIFRIQPNLDLLRKNRQQWEHSVKEHIAFYNMKQFPEHYHVSLSFTPSNTSSFYIAPQLREAYPFSTLEDTIAKFLRQYNSFWKILATALTENDLYDGHTVVYDLVNAIDHVLPMSPRNEGQESLAQSYRALYFDFYYITDELIWYGIRSNAGRHAITLADLVYGVVFGHDIFSTIFNRLHLDGLTSSTVYQRLDMRRLLFPWTRQLGYFLSFFPETQEATLALRQTYEPFKQFDMHR